MESEPRAQTLTLMFPCSQDDQESCCPVCSQVSNRHFSVTTFFWNQKLKNEDYGILSTGVLLDVQGEPRFLRFQLKVKDKP